MKSTSPVIGFFILVALLALFGSSKAASPFGSVNVDQFLRNPVVVQRQLKCLQCTGPCDRIGYELRRTIPNLSRTQCASCTTMEKINMGKIVNHVKTVFPTDWARIENMIASNRKCY